MIKKFIILTIILTFFIGCSESQLPEESIITLTIWENYNNEEHVVFIEIVDDFVKEYNKTHQDKKIKIQVDRVPFDGLLPKLKTSAMTKTTPDICRVDVAHVVPLAFGKSLVNLDKFGAKELHDKLVPAAINSNIIAIKGSDRKIKKGTYGLPDQTNTTVLFYNKTIFKMFEKELKEAGLNPDIAPRTWDELIKYGKIITKPDQGIYAFAMNNSLWWTFPFFNSFGVEFISFKDGKFITNINKEPAVQALQLKVDLYRKHKIEAGAWQSGAIGKEQGFINNKYAMIITGPWMLQSFKNSKVNFGTALIPAGPKGTSSNVGGTNMVIFKSCKHPEIAYEFLSYLVSEKTQVKWCNTLGQIPVVLSAFDKVDFKKFPEIKIFMEQMKTAKARPMIPNYDILETDIINPEMAAALSGQKTVKQALDDAAREIDKKILSIMNE